MDFERLVVAWAQENVAVPPATSREQRDCRRDERQQLVRHVYVDPETLRWFSEPDELLPLVSAA